MKRAIVIGSPGAGKSTFARKLRDAAALPLYYLDMIWHKRDGSSISREQFARKLEEIMRGERWIIDGNYAHTLEMRLKACDTVFLLDYPLQLCLAGAAARIGKKREDMPWVEQEFDEEFRQWILDFPQDQLPQIYDLLEQYQNGRDIFTFHSRGQAEDYLKTLCSQRPGEKQIHYIS